ncbi:hypothetical protein BFJ67_g14076 [Fusarium oxysporum f. sp. cepae]|nr:hypothetical protein BFJ67_g14076 [Fusarium oxysporum f. sp. cepae]
MPEQQQQGRQQNTNLLIHDMFRGGDDTTVHWEPTSHPVAVAWPVECLVSHEAKRHCITQQDVNNLVDFGSLEYAEHASAVRWIGGGFRRTEYDLPRA